MQLAEINKTFLARNVYRRWQAAIRTAETDITIFTPYFDKTLLTLLKANTTIVPGQITIVTNISPENALEMPYQLRAAKRALSGGISVRSLDGLHAKVLLIDQTLACIGSQNFTKRGRINKETTVFPAALLNDSTFVKTLHEWQIASREVSEEEIDELLSELGSFFRKHKKLHDDIHNKCVEVSARRAVKRNNLLLDSLKDLKPRSPVQLVSGEVYANIQWLYEGYESLLVTNDSDDLTRRIIKQPDGSYLDDALDDLYMYPVIFADSNRMAFARVANRRITYIRQSVAWSEEQRWSSDDVWADVSISFPVRDTIRRNIEVKLTTLGFHGACKFVVAFGGESVEVSEHKFIRGNADRVSFDVFVRGVTRTLLSSKKGLDAFFVQFLSHFRYGSLGIANKNAGSLFQRGTLYKVSIVAVRGVPLLVFENA